MFKAHQKEKREQAYANLAVYGEEFVGIAKFFLPFQQSQELMDGRRKLAKMPKMACGRFKDWLRHRSPWHADIWRLRGTLQPGAEYGHFHEGYFPKIGKLQKPVIPYREMVRRRYADMKGNASRLEAMLALHLRCAGCPRKQVEEEMQEHTRALFQSDSLVPKLAYLQRILDSAFGTVGDIIILNGHFDKQTGEEFNKLVENLNHNHIQSHKFINQELIREHKRRMR